MDEVADIVEGHIKEFSGLDNDSQESRYPVTSKGDISLEGCDKLDVRNFSEVMDKVGSYLEGTFDVLDEYINNLS